MCKIKHHDYFVIKRLSLSGYKLGCKRCPKQFAMNTDVRCVLPWDIEFENFYKDLNIIKENWGIECEF